MGKTATMRKINKICKRLTLGSLMLLVFIAFIYLQNQASFVKMNTFKLPQPWRLNSTESESDLTDWSFKRSVKCPELNISSYSPIRTLVSLNCKREETPFITQRDTVSSSIFEIPFGDTCLINAVDRFCKDNFVVPNIVHYVWFNSTQFSFFNFLSFMSAIKFIRPCLILIHGPAIPYGDYWDFFLRAFPNVMHVKRSRPTAVAENNFAYPEHASDVMRIEALLGESYSMGGFRGGGGELDPFEKSQVAIYFRTNTGSDLPREAIGPLGSNCFSREVRSRDPPDEIVLICTCILTMGLFARNPVF